MFENTTSDNQAVLDSVTKLCQREINRYQIEEFHGSVPRGLFKSFSELGLTGLSVSEKYGGIEADPFLTSLIIERIAAHDLGCAIFTAVHSMVCSIISRLGTEDQKKKYLPRLAGGDWLAAFALTEPKAGSDAAALTTKATKTERGYVLNGEKCYITSAGFADLYVVFAKTSPTLGAKGISAFIVEATTKGMSIGKPEKKMGAELSPIASVQFSDALIPLDALLGEENKGYSGALAGLESGRVSIAACAVGIADSAIKLANEHLSQREQFGSKLIEFQGLQFMLADMKMKLEASRLLTYKAAKMLGKAALSEQKLFASMAKCFATDSAMSITTDAVQLLGGAGYIREYKVERMMRDAKMLQIVEGTNQIQRMLIARGMR